MGLSRQECCHGLPFPSPGGLPDPGIKHTSPALHVILYCLSHLGRGVQKCLPIPLCHVQLFSSMISHPVYLFFECQASMSGHPVTSQADMMVWGPTHPHQGSLVFSLGDWSQASCWPLQWLFQNTALPEFPLTARCKQQLQLSWGGYPPIDHVLKSRNISGSGCVWVRVREWQRKSMLSCCNETEFMSRSRQFLLLFGTTHKTEAYVSDFLGTQFQRVVCVCVCVYVHVHAREKGLGHMGRAHENSCGQIHQHSPFSLQNVGCPREENHFCKKSSFEFSQWCQSLKGATHCSVKWMMPLWAMAKVPSR